jgi:hypothetical protein
VPGWVAGSRPSRPALSRPALSWPALSRPLPSRSVPASPASGRPPSASPVLEGPVLEGPVLEAPVPGSPVPGRSLPEASSDSSGCTWRPDRTAGRLSDRASSVSRAAASSAKRGCETSRARIAASSEIFIPDIRPPLASLVAVVSILRPGRSRGQRPGDGQKIWHVHGAGSKDIAAASLPAAPGVSSRT